MFISCVIGGIEHLSKICTFKIINDRLTLFVPGLFSQIGCPCLGLFWKIYGKNG